MIKKRYWRCNVCGDIHFGFGPPELCPTCKVQNAYVEISSDEARKTLAAGPEVVLSKTDFRTSIDAFAAKNEFQVNPDAGKTAPLIDGVFENEGRYGLKYCPCRLSGGVFEEDLKLVCPCNFPSHETYKNKPDGECWCGLFVRRKT
jgi:ferredoxin-thioredoxin reductase catalytic chain